MFSFPFHSGFSFTLKPPIRKNSPIISSGVSKGTSHVAISPLSYQKFVDFAMDEIKHRTLLTPPPIQENFGSSLALDGKTELNLLSFTAPKIRLLRSMYINGGDKLQVLDLGIFPEAEYDLPIFCANFFSNSTINIVVLDLNPLYNVISNSEYKNKYYQSLLHLGLKYTELLPWGGEITGESMRFFSPIVLWTRFSPSQDMQNVLFAAFKDYITAWLELMELAKEETNDSIIIIPFFVTQDPGHQLLRRLVGEDQAKDVLRRFLFRGVDELGSKSFLDYFPEYRQEDGMVSNKRSMMGKSFEHRPWNDRGEFIG
ncbi:hypothetical protein V2J09_003611 [Rumex salicifolius]